ncbi:MAG: 1-phosphofructokinase family hexose kinase [Anaerolineales bacterium]|nr:1-phosphofructokinase family hexose kinase [Anaerolineales bacterium]
MLLCVNPNAAIDKTVVVPGFHLNDIQRPESVRMSPGGKGCNVARAFKTLGGEPVVTGWIGGHAGAFIEEGLKAEGIGTAFVRVPFESRTCLSIVDPDGPGLTELYERGEPIPADAVGAFIDWFEAHVAEYAAVSFSGSLPPGAPADLYAQLIQLARARGVMTLLDSSGPGLAAGLAAGPDLIKPNAHEFEELMGRPLPTPTEVAQAARDWSITTGGSVVVSLGESGALAAQGDQAWQVIPPTIKLVSAVGSGDSLVAGTLLGILQGRALPDAVAIGVAAGAANAMSLGAAAFAKEQFERVLAGVRVGPIRPA